MIILGPSACLLKMWENIYHVSNIFDYDFVKFYQFTGMYAAIFIFILVGSGLVQYFLRITKFFRETYFVFCSTLLLVEGVRYLIQIYVADTDVEDGKSVSFLTTIVLFAVFWTWWQLKQFRNSGVFPFAMREVIVIAGFIGSMLFAAIYAHFVTTDDIFTEDDEIFVALSFDNALTNERVQLHNVFDTRDLTANLQTGKDFDMYAHLLVVPCGFLVALLICVEHTVCCQIITDYNRHYPLSTTLHWDLFFIGILLLLQGFLCYPFMAGSIALSAFHIDHAAACFQLRRKFDCCRKERNGSVFALPKHMKNSQIMSSSNRDLSRLKSGHDRNNGRSRQMKRAQSQSTRLVHKYMLKVDSDFDVNSSLTSSVMTTASATGNINMDAVDLYMISNEDMINRVTPTVVFIILLLNVYWLEYMLNIPIAVIAGALMVLGFNRISMDNDLWLRIKFLLFTCSCVHSGLSEELWTSSSLQVNRRTLQAFTFIQIVCCLSLFVVVFIIPWPIIAISFPLLFIFIIYLREFMERNFNLYDLVILDQD